MSWHDDCSSVSSWTIDNISDETLRQLISDGTSIMLNTDDITEDEGSAYVDFYRNIPVSGDFEITANVSIPALPQADANTFFDLDLYIRTNQYVYNSDASKSRMYFDFYFYKSGLGDNILYLYGLQNSSEGMILTLPFTGTWKIVKSGGIITAYVNDTVLWTSTYDNSAVTVNQLEFYIEAEGGNTYPMDMPAIKVNDVNIIGNTISTNAKLQSLVIDAMRGRALTPSFYYSTYTYTGAVGYTEDEAVFTVINQEGVATMSIGSTPLYSNIPSTPFPISIGENIYVVHVLAEDGVTTQDYTITLTRNATASSDATLSNITAYSYGGGTLTPSFNPSTLEYSYTQPAANTYLYFRFYQANTFATMRLDGNIITSGSYQYFSGLTPGTYVHEIEVTAEDGVTVKTYTLTIIKLQSTNPRLSSATISAMQGVALTPAWYQTTYIYTGNVSYLQDSTTFRFTPAEGIPTLTINGFSATPNVISQPFDLDIGENIFTIHSIAEDGVTTQDYTITLTRNSGLSSGCDLVNIVTSGGLVPSFSSSTLEYTWSMPYSTNSVYYRFYCSQFATMKINGTTYTPSSYYYLSSLTEGVHVYSIEITAEDGTKKTYTLTVTKLGKSNNGKLSTLRMILDGITTNGTPEVYEYNLSKAKATIPTFTIYCTAQDAYVKQIQLTYIDEWGGTSQQIIAQNTTITIPLHLDLNPITLDITAQDEVTITTYNINVMITGLPPSDSFNETFAGTADSGLWEYLGSAIRQDGYVQLCSNDYWSGGGVRLRRSITGNLKITFEYYMWNGVGSNAPADGISCRFYNNDDYGDLGGNLYWAGSSRGYGVNLDIYPWNPNDNGRTVELTQNYPTNHLVQVEDSRVYEDEWHTCRIEVVDNNIKVWIDDDSNPTIDWTGLIDRTYGRFMFSASTGNAYADHFIRNVVVETIPYKWDIAIDYGLISNPSGTWSYGYKTSKEGSFILHSKNVQGEHPLWHTLDTWDNNPAIWKNLGSSSSYGIPVGQVSAHPGQNGEYSTIRWTSPVATFINIVGNFGAGDGSAMGYYIYHNGILVWSKQDDYNDEYFELTFRVEIGDTVDFMTGDYYWYGNTPVNATITCTVTNIYNCSAVESVINPFHEASVIFIL